MKKLIIAAVLILTTGILTMITRDNSAKAYQTAKINVDTEISLTATAD